jgi:hypothetical protein
MRALDVELPWGSGLRSVEAGPVGLWPLGAAVEEWCRVRKWWDGDGDGDGESWLRVARRSIALLEVDGVSGIVLA